MTREEAIKELELIAKVTTWNDRRLAVDMAIEALTNECDKETHDSDIISRQWLLDLYGDYIGDNGDPKYHVPLEVVRQNIIDAPSAEPKRGEWVPTDGLGGFKCDQCGWDMVGTSNFCPGCGADMRGEEAQDIAIDALSAEVVQRWITDRNPTESGEYMATLDAWGHKYIDIMHYSKPMLPSRKVKGMCWYKADNEWGDVVYEDEDILAWMPLPMPYREDGE